MKAQPMPRFEVFPMAPGPVDESLRRLIYFETLQFGDSSLWNETSAITLLAGAGTRWSASLEKARLMLKEGSWIGGEEAPDPALIASFPSDAPRGLFPVPDYIRNMDDTGAAAAGPDGAQASTHAPCNIPMAAYAVDAVRKAGRHILVVRGWEEAIENQILKPLDLGPALRTDRAPASSNRHHRERFFTQKTGPDGKVHGHGDAVLQCRSLWRDARYVITNFGGDANSPLTVILAVHAMAAFDARGIEVGVVIPAARTEHPAYPVSLDEDGLPAGFWHEKLAGSHAGTIPTDLTNVGIRVYRADWLDRALSLLHERYFMEGIGWSIPGNDPSAHECALDNVDSLLAEMKVARVMPLALPRELTPLKSLDQYGAFVRAVRAVRLEWKSVQNA